MPTPVMPRAGSARAALTLHVRQIAQAIVRAKPAEIYFTAGGSEADNWALFGAIARLLIEKSHIITTQIEHHAF